MKEFAARQDWTKEDRAAFISVVEKDGLDYDKLMEVLPNKSKANIINHTDKMRDKISKTPGHELAHLFESLYRRRKWTQEDDKLMLEWLKDNPKEKHQWCQEFAKVIKTKTRKEIMQRAGCLRHPRRKKWLTATQEEIK